MRHIDQCSDCGGLMRLIRVQMMKTKTGCFQLGIHACTACNLMDLRPDLEITAVNTQTGQATLASTWPFTPQVPD
jgi:hypothetical protein